MEKLKYLIMLLLAVLNGVEYTAPEYKPYDYEGQYKLSGEEVPSQKEAYSTVYRKVYKATALNEKSKKRVDYKADINANVEMSRLSKPYYFRPTKDGEKNSNLIKSAVFQLDFLALYFAKHEYDKDVTTLTALKDAGLSYAYFTGSTDGGQTPMYFPTKVDIYKIDEKTHSNPEAFISFIIGGKWKKEFDYFSDMYPNKPRLGLGQNITVESEELDSDSHTTIKVTYGSLSRLYPDWEQSHCNDPYVYTSDDLDRQRPSIYHGLNFDSSDVFKAGQLCGVVGRTALPYRRGDREELKLLDQFYTVDSKTNTIALNSEGVKRVNYALELAKKNSNTAVGVADTDTVVNRINQFLTITNGISLQDIVGDNFGVSALIISVKAGAEYESKRYLTEFTQYEYIGKIYGKVLSEL